MKKKLPKKAMLAAAALLFLTTVNAQKNFKDGLVVLRNGDTVRGQIDYHSWDTNPLKIQFQNGGSVSSFQPSDLQYFEITGLDKYVSRLATRDMRLMDINKMSSGVDSDTTLSEIIFLRQLDNGANIKLYQFQDFKLHFFIDHPGKDSLEELQYKKYLNENSTGVYEKKIYRNQLLAIAFTLNAPDNLRKKIETCKYEEDDLLSISRQLNGEDEKKIQSEKKHRQNYNQFLVGGGVQYYSFSFNSNLDRFNNLKFDNGIGPVINVAYDVFGARNQQRLGLRFELAYTSIKLTGSYQSRELANMLIEHTYRLTQHNIIPGITVMYHFISTNTIRVYAGIGIGYVFSSYPTDELYVKNHDNGDENTYKNEVVPEKNWMIGNLLLGARINNKINLGLATKFSGAFYDYSGLGVKYFPVNFTVNYIFSNKNKNAQ